MAVPISAWAIRQPVAPLVLFALLLVLGVAGWMKLPVQGMPSIVIPVISVTAVQVGAAPADLERQVTRRIESAISGIAGVKHQTSTVAPGSSMTVVEFQLETPVDRAANEVRDAVARIRAELPAGVRDPVIERIDIMGLPILTYAVAGAGRSDDEMSWFVDDTISRELLAIPGIASVRRDGGVGRELRLEPDPERLQALGITVDQVDRAVRSAVADLPGGRLIGATQERLVRVIGAEDLGGISSATRVTGAAAVAQVRIALPGGRTATLGELGQVIDGAAEMRTLARIDGQPVVGFSLIRAKGASEVAVAEAVTKRLDHLLEKNSWLTLTKLTDWVQPTRDSFHSAMLSLIEGALLAVLVVLIFLRDWRATIIAGVAIPLSVIPTFAVMHLLGFSLNGVSLLAVSLVAGILVDDAIVEIENIVRFQRGDANTPGMTPWRAALIAADRIGLAVVATTFAIVVVFLPVSAMPGIAGKYFLEFGITVAVAVMMSLLVARLITPLMCAYFLQPSTRAHRGPGFVAQRYQRLLAWCLDHRATTMFIGVLVLAASIGGVPYLPQGFIAASDRSQSIAQVELPPGVTLSSAAQTVQALATVLRAQPEVTSVFARIEVPTSTLTVTLVPPVQRTVSTKGFEGRVRHALQKIPDQRFSFLGDNGMKEVMVQLLGDDVADLSGAAERLAVEMATLPSLANVSLGSSQPRPELQIRPRAEAASRLGVDAQTLAQVVRVALLGEDDTVLPRIELDGRMVPVRVQLAATARRDVDQIRALRVPTTAGNSVPLAAVADITWADGAATVERYDRSRRVVVAADLAAHATLGEALKAAEQLPGWKNLPPGVRVAPAGDAEVMAELFSGFIMALGLGVLCVYFVLVLLYHDLVVPLTILVALPLSLGGAVAGLSIAQMALDLSGLIGLLMLMGIVCKNSILLVDEALQQRETGLDRRTAMLNAGANRARPIIMTTLAMVAGMVPVVLGLSPDSSFRAPMAVTVIGGLLASTVLSLVFVPVTYTAFDDLRNWVGRRAGRLLNPSEEN